MIYVHIIVNYVQDIEHILFNSLAEIHIGQHYHDS